jgi:hypothetical protein
MSERGRGNREKKFVRWLVGWLVGEIQVKLIEESGEESIRKESGGERKG